MILDTTSKTIEVILGAAITTNQLEITADWIDTADGLTFAPGGTSLLTNGASAVTAVASPAANIQRQVKALTIYNADTVNATVTVRMFDGTNRRRHVSVTLLSGQSLVFTPEGGWQALDTNANLKQSLGGTTANLSDYSAGTFTPTDASGAGLTFSTPTGKYVSIGNFVMAAISLQYPSTANTNQAKIGSLPFNAGANSSSWVLGPSAAVPIGLSLASGGNSAFVTDGSGTPKTNANLSGLFVISTICYSK